jgi:26S proteasome regulatory subunit N5
LKLFSTKTKRHMAEATKDTSAPMEVEEDTPAVEKKADKPKKKKKSTPSWERAQPKKDFTKEVEEAVAKAQTLAKDGNLSEAINTLLPLEKATRNAQDSPACSTVVVSVTTMCFENGDWDTGISTVTMLAKRRSVLNTPVLNMVKKAIEYVEKSPSEEKKIALIEALREITEGKIFLELESARLTRMLAIIKEKNGDIAEAASIMQEVAVETVGSMDAREKADYILEQVRLCLAKKDYVRAEIIGKKIKRDKLVKQGFHDLKLRHCELMIEFNTHEKKMLPLAKDFLSRFNTPSVQEDEAAWTKALERVVVYIALAPQDAEQRQLIQEVYAEKKLAKLVDFKWVLERMRTPEVCLDLVTKASIVGHDMFTGKEWDGTETGVERGKAYWKLLRRRVMEMNSRTIAGYYRRIPLDRMAQLLNTNRDELEAILSDMVSDKILFCKIDRPMGIATFVKAKSPEEILDAWSTDVSNMLSLVDQTCHLISKETMVNNTKA